MELELKLNDRKQGELREKWLDTFDIALQLRAELDEIKQKENEG